MGANWVEQQQKQRTAKKNLSQVINCTVGRWAIEMKSAYKQHLEPINQPTEMSNDKRKKREINIHTVWKLPRCRNQKQKSLKPIIGIDRQRPR